MSEIARLLQLAAERGEIAEIVYNGGSYPGQSRSIIPVLVGLETVFAREPGLSREKNFKIAKIATVTLKDGTTFANCNVVPISAVKSSLFPMDTLADYATLLGEQYETLGWHVYRDDAGQSFGVAALLKSGKPRKWPTISISFVDRSVSLEFDISTGELYEQKKALTGRERPWRVESYLQPQAKAYGELHLAMEFFVAEVGKGNPIAGR